MSEIARVVTGLDKNQLREYESRRVDSQEEVANSRCVSLCQNVRLAAGLIVGVKDLDSEREKLNKKKPKSLWYT